MMSDVQLSYERAKAAFAHIVRGKNTAIPQSYAVWYAYIQGVPGELVLQIDACKAAACAVSDDQCMFAYDRFLAPVRETDIDKLFASLFETLQRTSNSVDYGKQGARQFSAELLEAEETLSQSSNPDSLRSLLTRLVGIAGHTRAKYTALSALLETSRTDIDEARASLALLRVESRTDSLTGLSNRRHFESELDEALESEIRPLSIAVFDIDHFKRFNDTYGHVTGDHVLKLVAAILKDCAGGRAVGRYGGEKFAASAQATAEKSRLPLPAGFGIRSRHRGSRKNRPENPSGR